CGYGEVQISRQPVAFTITTGSVVAARICFTIIPSPQPGHNRCPLASFGGRAEAVLRFGGKFIFAKFEMEKEEVRVR
ncbi:hypothetical protein KAI54_01620, partial [Candidatus Gracilibacteria bacterium]|nr:hypothetical protein [Candidatus Gracilibacteria bacterium]